MTYDKEVRDAMQDPSYSVRMRLGDGYLQALIDAIPLLTLKTEDGRFVKVEQAGWLSPYGVVPGGMDNEPMPYWKPLYRIVEAPE